MYIGSKWKLLWVLEQTWIWLDTRPLRKRTYRFAMLSLGWFLMCCFSWSFWLAFLAAWASSSGIAVWPEIKAVLLAMAVSLCVELANIFRDEDDRGRDGPPPEPAPWPQFLNGLLDRHRRRLPEDHMPEAVILFLEFEPRRLGNKQAAEVERRT